MEEGLIKEDEDPKVYREKTSWKNGKVSPCMTSS